jgi:hypothetical protein
MKKSEILALLPECAKASPEAILASPAWAMPCRFGETSCTMMLDATRPADTLDLAIRLEDEDHVLSIADAETFTELHAVWSARADIPKPILLALVEKDCGLLLQLIENAAHKQLSVQGLAEAPAGEDALAARIVADGKDLAVFNLSTSPSLVSALGVLRFIDVSNDAVRDTSLAAEVEYSSFTLSAADVSALAPGDYVLLPEVGSREPRIIVDGRFSIAESGVTAWVDDGSLRVVRSEPMAVKVGELMDASEGGRAVEPPPTAEMPLRLMRFGKTVATGRFGTLASQNAFLVDAVSV